MRAKKSVITVGLCVFSTASQAQITNAGFELPALGNGSFTSAPGWTVNGDGGAWNIFPGYTFFNAEAPEGTQIAYSNGNMAQQTGYRIKEGLNRVQVLGARRDSGFNGSFDLQLYAGGTVASGNVTGGTLLDTESYVHTLYPVFSFTPLTVEFNALPGDPRINQLISIRFLRVSGQINYDEVKVGFPTAPVVATGIETEIGIPFGGDLPQVTASDNDYYYVLSDENEPNAQVRFDFSGLNPNPSYLTLKAETNATRDDLNLFAQLRNQTTNVYAQFSLGTSTLTDTTRTLVSATNIHQLVSASGTANVRLRWVPNQDLEAADGWSEAVDFVSLEFWYH